MLVPSSPPKFILYARKSSESEDAQVASIDSQIKELEAVASREGLQVVATLSEARSAKAPGRPVFGELLARIHRAEASGILCWKLDRLARNPVDGGNVSWMLQQGILQRIRTHERAYTPADNVLMMSVEFGMANQYVRDLSHNVRRGLAAKVEKGWFPGVAKPGYINAMDRPKGERTTPPDPVRFPLLQRAFRLVLSGRHSPPQVLTILNQDWGYRTTKRRRLGGVPLPASGFYRILTDPFYYGRFEFPRGSGNWFQGQHVPMISEEEFWRVQELLGRKGKPRPQKHSFAYTGLIACGECGAAVTAEITEHVVCSRCRRKFASKHRDDCPSCGLGIPDMQPLTRRRYEYYHCSKRKGRCTQRFLQVGELEDQVLALLGSLTLSEPVKDWCLQRLDQEASRETEDRAPALAALEEAQTDCRKRLDNLLKLAISPQNSSGELLSAEEFAQQKTALARELRQLETKTASVDDHAGQWKDAAVRTFKFACYARKHFQKGSLETKRAILSSLGSDLVLQDRILRISLHKHLIFVQRLCSSVMARDGPFGPRTLGLSQQKNRVLGPAVPNWRKGWDDVRTLFKDSAHQIARIPQLTAL